MKTYTSFLKYADAKAYAEEQVKDYTNGYIKEGSVDCDKVDCPKELASHCPVPTTLIIFK